MNQQMKMTVSKILGMEANIFVTGVPDLDGSGDNDVSLDTLLEIAKTVTDNKPTASFMLVVAGKSECSALCYEATSSNINGCAWLTKTGMTTIRPLSPNVTYGSIVSDSTIKMKDQVISLAFSYLKSVGLYEEEEDVTYELGDW
jgi:hypothetical protein